MWLFVPMFCLHLRLKVCSLVWWWFWNFIVLVLKCNRFLHPNELPKQRLDKRGEGARRACASPPPLGILNINRFPIVCPLKFFNSSRKPCSRMLCPHEICCLSRRCLKDFLNILLIEGSRKWGFYNFQSQLLCQKFTNSSWKCFYSRISN